ncbi:MAG: DUF3450 family protein [Methylobacter sp.]|nr:DUF3450 family protein [Methylobacter sp.]MDP2429077.1 DUF3450 family protein [Methylobacter sp.]MDP3054490.1 DUF3450 family protein [Methylobacter sp.]MDP3362389.1 DUF3450 family protein [Methylobacter sp.]MDZ4218937.1 DUF3450 family protein [Methylobacter sp.]
MMIKQRARSAYLLVALLLVAPLSYGEALGNLTQSLIQIRSEVEELQSQLDMEKQDHKSKMDSLGSQMSDLSVENRRQKLGLEKLEQAVQKLQASKQAALSGDEALMPVVLSSLGNLREVVAGSLPFKVDERLSELDSLKSQLENGSLDPKRAANRIWAFIEDEIRLTRENGVYSQTIELDGKSLLADIAKLGSMFIYFQTSNNQVGMAQKKEGAWQFVEMTDPASKQQISTLFESLKKQIRQGYFELPNPLEL